ncbi:hypothetical protein O6P43_000067 [Quillaja saponaria]|uniref:Uncharacterized protein n=1 Tax=Quillaja saponaria TaxID=32244 RepID=A0AAD7QFR9_QUISA|nr:hypothetical protein O6P43_000067 [Quillaja saponaria]
MRAELQEIFVLASYETKEGLPYIAEVESGNSTDKNPLCDHLLLRVEVKKCQNTLEVQNRSSLYWTRWIIVRALILRAQVQSIENLA